MSDNQNSFDPDAWSGEWVSNKKHQPPCGWNVLVILMTDHMGNPWFESERCPDDTWVISVGGKLQRVPDSEIRYWYLPHEFKP